MVDQNITPEEWLRLSDEKKKSILSKWDVYKGEGSEIIKATCYKFKEEYKDNKHIKDIHFGIYHGGDWIIGVTIKWMSRNKIKLPKIYQGFAVQIFYDGIPVEFMRRQAKKQFRIWFKEIKKNYETIVKKDEYFKDMPKAKFYELAWLMDGMSKYYNPFKG